MQIFDAADRLASVGQFDKAVALLKVVTEDINPDYRAEARVRIARYLLAKGDKYGAAYWYRQLLDEKPDAAAVRIELARLLAAIGEEKAASQELRRAEAIGLPPEVSRIIRNASEAFRNNKPIGFSASVGVAPDTNINSATASDTIDIFGLPFQLNEDGRARSGVGLTFDANLVLRRPMIGTGRLITEITASGRLYKNGSFNDLSFALGTGPELHLSPVLTVRPVLSLGRRIFGADKLYDFASVSAVEQIRAGPKAQITLNQSITQLSYSALRDGQSGPAYTLATAYERAFSGRFAARLGLTGTRVIAREAQYSSKALTGDLTLSRDFGHWTIFTRGSYTLLKGDADFSLFGSARNDKIREGSAGDNIQKAQCDRIVAAGQNDLRVRNWSDRTVPLSSSADGILAGEKFLRVNAR